MQKPKVGILTAFTGADFGYSLIVVVHTQIQMLLSAGYHPVLFVAPSFHGEGYFSDNKIEIRRHLSPDAKADDIQATLRPMIADIDIMICHDLLFLSQHREWGEAIRKLALEYSRVAWLHWQHSRGDHAPIEPMKNSWFCYPNQGDLGHVAEINSTTLHYVRYIPHPLDFQYLGWPKLAIQIADDYQFPFVDISMIMPARLDRQKQIEKLIRVFAGLKQAGKSICLLVGDAFATGEPFLTYKKECRELAASLGMINTEFAFLGDVYEECRISTPHPVIKALFEMSNLFIQPSTAETSSLVVMEAALAGNFVIINSDFPPIHHLYKKAMTLPFGSIFEATKYYRNITTADGHITKVLDDQLFWTDRARDTIIPALDSQLTLQLKRQQLQERWPSRVMKSIDELIFQAQKEICVDTHETVSKGDPEVTAIITTLDNLPMLKRQIDILRHEAKHIIVVNNGSIDGTREWLGENADIPGLSFINRENKGAGPGRNAGLSLWKESTPYTLMLDGGILPPIGAIKMMKEYLLNHPDVEVISPEVATSFTTDEDQATLIAPPVPEQTFPQSYLSSTALCLCRASAWRVRFSEEGPYGEPGWGVDDNDMALRWQQAGVNHQDFSNIVSGWMIYRRQSGSFKRLQEETGIWPNGYGSVYEKRLVKLHQDWAEYLTPPKVSYILDGIRMPEFAEQVKRIHNEHPEAEVICQNPADGAVEHWLDVFALRQHHGDTSIDTTGEILRRGENYPEELWSGNVVRNRGPIATVVFDANVEICHDLAAPA